MFVYLHELYHVVLNSMNERQVSRAAMRSVHRWLIRAANADVLTINAEMTYEYFPSAYRGYPKRGQRHSQ